MNGVVAAVGPSFVSAIDADAIDRLKSDLQARGDREISIGCTLRHAKAPQRRAHRLKLVRGVPTIDMPKRTWVAAGRPIREADYAKLLAAVPGIDGERSAASWDRLLRGLWTSGLRIGAAAYLSWDDVTASRIATDGERPKLLVPGDRQKAGHATIIPIGPEFQKLLCETSEAGRRGFVFDSQPSRPEGPRSLLDSIRRTAGAIGKAWASGSGPTERATSARTTCGGASATTGHGGFCRRPSRFMPGIGT